MATKPDIATNLAFQNLLSENQKKYEDLKKQQKTISSLPRTLRVNRRNRYSVVDQKTTKARSKLGHTRVQTASAKLPLISPPDSLPSSKRSRRRRKQRSRQSSLSERTFRKDSSATRANSRSAANPVETAEKLGPICTLRKTVTERVQQTTGLLLPSLRMTNLTQCERPFVRPLNAIEQVLNDEVVEPTSSCLIGVRQFLNCTIESAFPAKNQDVAEATGNIPALQTRSGIFVDNPNATQAHRQTYTTKAPNAYTGVTKEGRFLFGRVAQVGIYAKLLARKIRLNRLVGHRGNDDVNLDDFRETGGTPAIASPASETLKALRGRRAPLLLLSACLSFLFGLPVRPYPPGKHGPQMMMSPILTLSYSNLYLSPGKEHLTDTIDMTDLRSEQIRQILRVRLAMNNGGMAGFGRMIDRNILFDLEGEDAVEEAPQSPVSCVLEKDPEFESFLLPLDSSHTLLSPGSNVILRSRNPRSGSTFTEFGYQVVS